MEFDRSLVRVVASLVEHGKADRGGCTVDGVERFVEKEAVPQDEFCVFVQKFIDKSSEIKGLRLFRGAEWIW